MTLPADRAILKASTGFSPAPLVFTGGERFRGLKGGRGMTRGMRWSVWFVGIVMVCASFAACWVVAQPLPEASPDLETELATVQGFSDVVRSSLSVQPVVSRRPTLEEEVTLPAISTRQAWSKVLTALNFRLPSRSEGWKFADYSWQRWRGVLQSRHGNVRRWRILTMKATAYCPHRCCGSPHGRTATGRRAEYGIVAVDPRVIPLGSVLYVDEYGFAIAADTGRLIKGLRIDLCFPSHREAARFGRRTLRVLLLR